MRLVRSRTVLSSWVGGDTCTFDSSARDHARHNGLDTPRGCAVLGPRLTKEDVAGWWRRVRPCYRPTSPPCFCLASRKGSRAMTRPFRGIGARSTLAIAPTKTAEDESEGGRALRGRTDGGTGRPRFDGERRHVDPGSRLEIRWPEAEHRPTRNPDLGSISYPSSVERSRNVESSSRMGFTFLSLCHVVFRLASLLLLLPPSTPSVFPFNLSFPPGSVPFSFLSQPTPPFPFLSVTQRGSLRV